MKTSQVWIFYLCIVTTGIVIHYWYWVWHCIFITGTREATQKQVGIPIRRNLWLLRFISCYLHACNRSVCHVQVMNIFVLYNCHVYRVYWVNSQSQLSQKIVWGNNTTKLVIGNANFLIAISCTKQCCKSRVFLGHIEVKHASCRIIYINTFVSYLEFNQGSRWCHYS